MNLADIIEALVEEKGLDRKQVTDIVCEGIKAAYQKKYPSVEFSVVFNKKYSRIDVFAQKEVVQTVDDNDRQVSIRKIKTIAPNAVVGEKIDVTFEQPIGRIEILTARQVIASKIRILEWLGVYEEFKEKVGSIITGVLYKKERKGFTVKIGDVMGILPKENFANVGSGEGIRVGVQIKALLKEVLKVARQDDYQLILDRSSEEFVRKLIELEIPEVFEGIVEIKRIVRTPGYKTKIIVMSMSKEIDPVGTCVGVGGGRIKPILRELGQEKVDLIKWTEIQEDLVGDSLKPAEIDKVEIIEDKKKAIVWLAQDQRSLAVGKMGQNISLASRLVGLEIHLQDVVLSQKLYDTDEDHLDDDIIQHDTEDLLHLSEGPAIAEDSYSSVHQKTHIFKGDKVVDEELAKENEKCIREDALIQK